jgi:hypothetical protein
MGLHEAVEVFKKRMISPLSETVGSKNVQIQKEAASADVEAAGTFSAQSERIIEEGGHCSKQIRQASIRNALPLRHTFQQKRNMLLLSCPQRTDCLSVETPTVMKSSIPCLSIGAHKPRGTLSHVCFL